MYKTSTKFVLGIFAFFICLLTSNTIMAQCEFVSRANDIIPNKVCAPVSVDWNVIYRGVPTSATTVEIEIDWDDGTPVEVISAVLTNPGTREFQVTANHVYPAGGDQCLYEPIAYLRANNTRCSSSGQEQSVTVWDVDTENGGELIIEPTVYRVCAGTDATVTFRDDSDWNCTPPEENDVVNKRVRWIQWQYGTLDDGRPRIDDIEVGTTPGPTVVNEPTILDGDITVLPGPRVASGEISLPVYVPTTAAVGEVFEVTLRNWNQCNPYDADTTDGNYLNPVGGNFANGDNAPVTQTAIILVVPAPDPEFTPRKGHVGGDVRYEFCPGENIFLNNATSAGAYSWDWRFYDSGGVEVGNSSSRNPTISFPSAGDYTIELSVTDDDAEGSCVATEQVDIEIIASPEPDMEVYVDGSSSPTTALDFCEIVGGDYDFSIANTTFVPTGSTPEYRWRLQRNGVTQISEITTSDINETFDFSVSQPGEYEVRLTANDAVTGCLNRKTIKINIYNSPEADFEIAGSQNLCVGELTDFNDLSGFASSLGFSDDEIVAWNWWFDYADDPTATPINDQNPSHIFTQVKDYEVRLEVETKYGCFHEITKTVTVNPIAKAEITVDDPDDCAPHVATFTNVHANNQTPVDVERYDWLIYSGGILVDSIAQEPNPSGDFPDTLGHTFYYTRTDNIDQEYEVFMRAYAVGGCVTTSDPIDITIFPTASAKFNSDYNPLANNCTPVRVNFEVDQATKDLPFSKDYRWTVSDENGLVFQTPTAAVDTFYYDFTSTDSISVRNYEVMLEVFASSGPCMQPFTQQININPTPSSKFTASRSDECEYVVVTLDANQKGLSASNYFWDIKEVLHTNAPKSYGNNPALDDNFSLQFLRGDADSTVEVTLRTRNFAGCESTGPAMQFLIPAKDDFEVLFDTAAFSPKCVRYTAAFENMSNVPAGTDFQLKVKRGSSAAFIVPADSILGDINSIFQYNFNEAGDYIVTLIGNHADGCSDETDINITVHPQVEAVFNPSSTSVCPGQQLFLNEASQPAAIIQDKEWIIRHLSDPGVGDTLVGSQLFYIFDEPGNYEITLRVTSNNGCYDEEIKTITVLPRPQFTLNFNDSSCDQTFSFSITATDPGITVSQYDWNWGDGNMETTTADNASHIYMNRNGYSGQDQYSGTVTATSVNGCSYTETFTVTLLQDVSTSFLMDKDAGCAPLAVVFDDVSIGADPTEQKWSYREFSPTTGSWNTFDGVSHVFTNTTSTTKVYQVRLESESLDDCPDQLIKDIIVDPEVVADFSMDNPTGCGPLAVAFTNLNVRSGVEYVWSWGDGTDNDTTLAETTIAHTFENSSYSVARNFKVRLTAVDLSSDCSKFIEKTVTVQPSIRVETAPKDTVGCSPLFVEIANNYQGISMHDWHVINTTTGLVVPEFGGSNPDYGANLTNSTFDTIRYQVVYTGTASNGICSMTDTTEVLVYPEIVPSFTATPLVQNLPNSTVTVTNTTHSNPGYTYDWNFGNGTFSTDRNPGPIEYTTYGLYDITLTVMDQFGQCSQEVIQTVEIKPTIPEIDFEYNPAEGCGPLTVQFTSKAKYVESGTLRWDFGDNSTSLSSEENPTYTYYEPGEYTVTLQGTNAIGVTVTEAKSYIIKVYDNPRANFRVRQRMPVYIPDSVIFLNESEGAVSYFWDFGDGNTSTAFEPKHAYAAPGDYTITLIAISDQGCADTLVRAGEIEIAGQFEVKIPNVFTPNGDQDNEIFLPLMQGVVDYNLLIFNRWGELLFESKNQEVGWDGYYKGVLSPPDVYIYKLDLKFVNGERTTKYGDITLLR